MADNITQTESIVSLKVMPSATTALAGVLNSISLLVEVATGDVETLQTSRCPMNLAIVLDKSGSMASQKKLENCKKAIVEVVSSLARDDQAHLVVYDSNTQIVFENKTSENLQEMVNLTQSICSGSMTNLWAGMEVAASLLDKYQKEGYENRVMLFSDGVVNEGPLLDTPSIANRITSDFVEQRKAKVSSFGIGSDFNEELMKQIAENGLGEYFFIDSSDSIPQFVTDALSSFLQPAVYDASLKLRGLNGAVITTIYGVPDIIKGVQLGDLRPNNKRSVIAEMTFAPSSSGSQAILEYEFRYRPLNSTEFVILKETMSIHCTENAEEVEKSRNNLVIAKAIIASTSKLDEEAKIALSQGKVQTAKDLCLSAISSLEKALVYDESGSASVALFLTDARCTLKRIEQEGSSARNIKLMHAKAYMKERNCDHYTKVNALF